MKILLAPNAFKHNLTQDQLIEQMKEAIHKVDPNIVCSSFYLADGGDGTLEAMAKNEGIFLSSFWTFNANDQIQQVPVGLFREKAGIIESAKVVGFKSTSQRNPMDLTTRGIGRLIKILLDKGMRKILIGLGGTSTIDGGCGMLSELGFQFLNEEGEAFLPTSKNLGDISAIDKSHVDKRIYETEFLGLSDVISPILGPFGAAKLFGPQKGATPKMVEQIESGMASLCDLWDKMEPFHSTKIAGGGAAGGLGLAIVVGLHGKLISGADYLLQQGKIQEKLKGVDYCFTGEGQIDSETLKGKAIAVLAKYTKEAKVPLIAFAGNVDVSTLELQNANIDVVLNINREKLPKEQAILQSKKDLQDAIIGFLKKDGRAYKK